MSTDYISTLSVGDRVRLAPGVSGGYPGTGWIDRVYNRTTDEEIQYSIRWKASLVSVHKTAKGAVRTGTSTLHTRDELIAEAATSVDLTMLHEWAEAA